MKDSLRRVMRQEGVWDVVTHKGARRIGTIYRIGVGDWTARPKDGRPVLGFNSENRAADFLRQTFQEQEQEQEQETRAPEPRTPVEGAQGPGYLIGQRVLIGREELGVVCKPEHDNLEGVWVMSLSRGYACCYDPSNVRPLPGGLL